MEINILLRDLPVLFAAMFTAILFAQSGFDKVFDRQGNLEWLQGHFSKTFLAGLVPLMLFQITVLEILTSMLAAGGVVYYLITGGLEVIFWAAFLGAATITALFFGQRIAKDYAGAAVLVPYFLVMLVMMYLSVPGRLG